MSSAADAVADMIAPPPRAAEPRRAPDKADGPSFDEHLDAAEPRERAETKETKSSRPGEARKDDADDYKTDAAEAAIAAQATPVQPAPPPTPATLLHLLASQDPNAQSADDVAPQIAQAAPTGAEPANCAPPPQQPLQAAPPVGPAADQKIQPEDSHAQLVAPTHDAKAMDALTKTTEPTPPQSVPEAAPTPQPSAEQTQAAAQVALPTPVTPTQEARPTSQRATPAIDATRTRGAAKADAPTADVKADPKADPPNTKAIAAAFRDHLAAAAEAHDLATPAPAPAQGAPTSALATSAAPVAQTSVDPLTAARAAPAAAAPAAAAQVGREIIRRFDGKNTHFDMRLDPPELGRVDIRLEVSRDHRVTAVVSADSPQALTELARHARELEQTLQSAGLELSENGLSFDLNQSRQGSADSGDDRSSNSARAGAAASDTPEPAAIAARPLGLESWRGVRVDVTA